ncbi:MAG: hypothetical protein NVS3B10_08070 [Polyangiales bacterium]
MRPSLRLLGSLLVVLGAAAPGCSSSSSAPAAGEDPCAGLSKPCIGFIAGVDDEAKIQSGSATALPGTTLAFGAGTFKFKNPLVIATERISLVGKGLAATILDFSGQVTGSEAVSATRDGFLVQDLAVRDAKGDAIKVTGATGVTFRRARAEWSGTPSKTNGPYGLYPVSCKQVLIEDSQAYGASDAGIYVGQSDGIVVRRNVADHNVAGIEIENSKNAEVTGNDAHDNTAGILVFDLPGLPAKGGGTVRVHDNKVRSNGTDNFSAAGSIVHRVPAGTGMLVMANSGVEVFANTIDGNGTVSLAIVSYYVATDPDFATRDPAYYPYPTGVFAHDNVITNGGANPDIHTPIGNTLKVSLSTFPGGHVPDVIYDGILDTKRTATGKTPNAMDICVRLGAGQTFADLHASATAGPGAGFPDLTTDPKPYACDLTPLAEVTTTGAGR